MNIDQLSKNYMLASAAATEIGVTRAAIFDRIARGTLDSVRVGKSVYVLRSLVRSAKIIHQAKLKAAKLAKRKLEKSGNNADSGLDGV